MPDTDLMCVVYVSASTAPMSDDDLLLLLRQARAHNERAGITGMLLHKNGRFMQALEGPRATVLALYRRITTDPRHRDVTTLIKFAIAERAFGNWSMGFADPGSIPEEDRPTFSDFLERELTDELYRDGPHLAVNLLSGFRRYQMAASA
jgi:hypothetical protein